MMLSGADLTLLKDQHMRVLCAAFNEQYLMAAPPQKVYDPLLAAQELERFRTILARSLREISPGHTKPAHETLLTNVAFQCKGNALIGIVAKTKLNDPPVCSVEAWFEESTLRALPLSSADTRVVYVAPRL